MAKVMRKQHDTRRKNALMDMSMEPAAVHNFMTAHNRRAARGGAYFDGDDDPNRPIIDTPGYPHSRNPAPRLTLEDLRAGMRNHRQGGSWLTPSTWGKDLAHEFAEPSSVLRRKVVPATAAAVSAAALAHLLTTKNTDAAGADQRERDAADLRNTHWYPAPRYDFEHLAGAGAGGDMQGGSWLTPSTWGKDLYHEVTDSTSVFRRKVLPTVATLAASLAVGAVAANERDRLNAQRQAREDSYRHNPSPPYKDYPPYSDTPDYYDPQTWENSNNQWEPGSWQDAKQREYDNMRFEALPNYQPDLISFPPGGLPPPDITGMYGMGKASKKSAKASAKPKASKKGSKGKKAASKK